MGFSAVSIIEIFYFISIRPYCANRKLSKSKGNGVNIGKPKKMWKIDNEIVINSRLRKIKLTPKPSANHQHEEQYGYLE